ncbi:MAG: PKD domain-containing protein, partial [Vicingaceae bacterium]
SGANTLSQLGFYVTNQPIYSIPGYTIKIKHTNANNVSNSLGTTGWTTVKNGFTYSPTPGGYDMILFDTPFNWNGTQNIGIEICWSQVQPNSDASGQCRVFSSTRGYRYRRDNNGGSICGTNPNSRLNTKPQVQLIFKTAATWTGNINNDWFNNGNWDIGAPTKKLDAIIPAGPANMPSIGAAGAECKNLEINSGASLTLAGSNNIDIYKNWTNNGTFTANLGNVTLKGTSTNSINGASNQNLYDLTIDNVNGAVISSGSINLHGTLDIGIATGNFNTNNALTIISNASGTGRIDELTSKCIYTLTMSDNYGDSWNGGYITVRINGIIEGTYFAKGFSSTSNFIAPVGATIQLGYSAGIYEWENSYTLTDGTGSILFSDGPTPSTGTNVFNTVANCSFFNPISGNITMQRYIPAGATTWRYLTSAISGTTIADFSDDFLTTGFIGSNYPPDSINPQPFVSIYTYNESVPGIIDSGFVHATNVTNPIGVGQGMWALIDGNQATNIDIVGPPNVGNINIPISYTNNGTPASDGWNMVGNPYPSSINWDSPGVTKTNVNNAIYIWNASSQQFASYVSGIGTNGGSANIASSQGFWVQANAPGASLQVTESSKSAVDVNHLRPAASNAPLRIKTENSFGKDELVINMEPFASLNFDGEYDAEKIASSNTLLPRSSSILGGQEYSINQINPQELDIPIKILSGATGNHTIKIENAYEFNPSSCLILEDLFTGNSYNLSFVDSFSTVIYDTTQTARFLLHIGAPIDIEKDDISCFGNTDAQISFTKNSINTFDILWKDQSSSIIASATNVTNTDSLINLNAGTYYIETTDALCGNHIDTVTINEPSQITAQFNSDIDTTYLSNGGIVNFTNLSTNAISYSWNFGGNSTSSLFSPSHQFTSIGTYTVTLNASQNQNCSDTHTKNITVLDVPLSISSENLKTEPSAWINNNTLLVKDSNNSDVIIRNILGETLFSKSGRDQYTFDLSKLSSQMLIISINDRDNPSTIKVNFVK